MEDEDHSNQEESMEEEEEDNDSMEDEVHEAAAAAQEGAGADAEVEEKINTFLEFTGSEDRARARLFIEGTDSMEEALNLFLTGASPPPPRRQRQQQQQQQREEDELRHGLLNPSSLLAHLEALADRGDMNALLSGLVGGGGGPRRGQAAAAAAAAAGEDAADLPFNFLARSLLGGAGDEGGFEDFLRAHLSIPSNNGEAMQDDEALYDAMSDADMKAKLDALAAGHVDVVSLLGTHLLRSVDRFKKFHVKLVASIRACLTRVTSTDLVVRVLQLCEMCVLVLAHGLDEAEYKSIGWFLPPRRIGASRRSRAENRRKLARESFIAAVEVNDLATLRRMSRHGELDLLLLPSSTEEGLMELAHKHGATPECMDLITNRPSRFPLASDVMPQNGNAEEGQNAVWRDLTLAMFQVASQFGSGPALHRALELLVLLVKVSPEQVLQDQLLPTWTQLLTALALPSNRNANVLQGLARELVGEGLLRVSNDAILIDLARNGTLYHLGMHQQSLYPELTSRMEALGTVLDGRPARLQALRATSSQEEEDIVARLMDMTPFEFEQSNAAQQLSGSEEEGLVLSCEQLDAPMEQAAAATTPPPARHPDSFLTRHPLSERRATEEEAAFTFSFGKIQQQQAASRGGGVSSSTNTPRTLRDHLAFCAQSLISEAGLPQISHDFAEDLGVRVLLSTFLLKLQSNKRQNARGEVKEFSLHALPLTPKRELERQVLRCSTLMDDARYVDYCQNLVGMKLALEEFEDEIFVCTKFNSKFGVHRLKSRNQQHWRVLALCKYTTRERLFDADDLGEISNHDDAESMDCVVEDTAATAAAAVDVRNEGQEIAVCVWWEGSSSIRAGWRIATAAAAAGKDQDDDTVTLTFPFTPGLVFDQEIRIGSLCREVSSTDFVQVSSISGKMCSLASSSRVLASEALIKLADNVDEQTYASHRPNVGDAVGVINAKGAIEYGILLADEMTSRLPYVVQLASNESDRFADCAVFAVNPNAAAERISMDKSQLVQLQDVGRANQDHIFSVYLRPPVLSEPATIDFSRPVPVAAAATGVGAGAARGDEEDEGEDQDFKFGGDRFALGQKIEGQYLGKSRWYRGHVSRVNADGTYDLHYLDGDMERCVARRFIRAVDQQAPAAAGSAMEEISSQPPPSPPSYDFRKAFPSQVGKILFDALRRDDGIIRNEYNFVTRGFEHQPNFYQSFEATLERYGAGVFARFQNFAQADALATRCAKCEVGAVRIRRDTESKPPAAVLREICTVFSRQEVAQHTPPPKPGSRCLLRVGPHARLPALVAGSKSSSAWISATVVSKYSAVDQSCCVVTDEGVFYFQVPHDHVKEAPTTPPNANPMQAAPPRNHRPLRFGSAGRLQQQEQQQQQAAAANSRLDTPIELSRQFSVFGSSNSLRYLSVKDANAPSPSRPTPRKRANPLPRFIVEFEKEENAHDNAGLALVDEEEDEESCLFRFLFEHYFAHEPLKRNTLRTKWANKRLALTWKVRIVFPQDEDLVTPVRAAAAAAAPVIPPQVSFAIHLLRKLQDGASTTTTSGGNWVNAPLSNKFKRALRDPLCVATRTLPRWMQTLPHAAPFLFQERERVQFLKSVTIGVSRSITYLQDEVTGYSAKKRELAQATLELSQFFKEAQPNSNRINRLTATCDRLEDEIKQLKETRFIGQLRQDLVKVDPNKNLLRDAMSLMEQHVGERSELIVQFVGENVSGEGVTNEFYGAVGAELSRSEQEVPMWATAGVSTAGSSAFLGAEFLNPALGLFPHPLFPASKDAAEHNERVVERFRFLGRLFAQAFLDEKQIPLPIAVEFFELLKRRQVPDTRRLLHCIEGEEGGMICALYDLLAQGADVSAEVAHRLEESELYFVDPCQKLLPSAFAVAVTGAAAAASHSQCIELPSSLEIVSDAVPAPSAAFQTVLDFCQSELDKGRSKDEVELALEGAGHSKVARFRVMKALISSLPTRSAAMYDENRHDVRAELVPGGKFKRVDIHNVADYCARVVHHWTDTGIAPQIAACRAGLQDILGRTGTDTLLDFFSAQDLGRMFCGEQEMRWNEDDALLGFLVPKGEYSANSREIRMLVDCLKLMTMKERSSFLSFCTALPRVPLSGLPQIKVFPPPKCRVASLVLQPASGSSRGSGEGEAWLQTDKNAWFAPGDKIQPMNVLGVTPGVVSSWDAASNTVHLRDNASNNREFRKGMIVQRVDGGGGNGTAMGEFVVRHCIEQCEVVQSPPLLRPKATTCVMTLYLPQGYESPQHMLRVFQEAFEDAKLGGLQDV